MDVPWGGSSQNLCGFCVFPLPIEMFYEWKTKGAGSVGSSQDGQRTQAAAFRQLRAFLLAGTAALLASLPRRSASLLGTGSSAGKNLSVSH